MKHSFLTRVRVSTPVLVVIAILVALTPVWSNVGAVRAAGRTTSNDSNTVTINGGGGKAADGSDGIAMVFNETFVSFGWGGGDDIIYKGVNYTYSPGDTGLHMNIGGQLYSTMNDTFASECLLFPATMGTCVDTTSANTLPFDSLVISDLTGSARQDASFTAVGAGGATFTYTVVAGDGKTYILKRIITYTANAKQYTDEIQVTQPTGSAYVRLYKGGDLTPGGSDDAMSIYITSPVKNIQSVETSSGSIYGMKEVASETTPSYFAGAVADRYYDVYDEVTQGLPIGFHDNQDPLYHDAGAMIEYDLGTTAGLKKLYNITYVGEQAVNLEAAWSSSSIASVGELNITLTNSLTAAATGLGYTFTAPAGTKIGSVTTDCDDTAGTVNSNPGTGLVILDGATLAALSSCTLTVQLIKIGTTGAVSIDASNFTDIEGTSMNVAVEASSATFSTLAPTFTNTRTATRTPTASATATATWDPSVPTYTTVPATDTSTPSNTRTAVPATNTAVSTATKTRTAAPATNTPVPPTATKTPTKTSTPTNTPTLTPTPIQYMMKKGAVGASFVLGLLQNGTLVSWGMNREFQANIPPCCGSGIDDVAVGTNFALALKGGKVYGWGANTLKQIAIPAAAAKDITAIAAGGDFGLALNKKGGVVYWGSAKSPVKKMPKTLSTGIKLIAGGTSHALAVTTKNAIIGWGNGKQGQTTSPAKKIAKKIITQVSAGLDHSLALLSTGTVVAWGNNSKKQTLVPTSAVDIKFISAGNKFSVALSNSGKVFAWGDNSVNQISIPTEYTDIYTVAASYANTILGLRNGRIIVIGNKSNNVGVSRTPTKTATPTP